MDDDILSTIGLARSNHQSLSPGGLEGVLSGVQMRMLQVVCARCRRATLNLGPMDIGGMTESERWDIVSKRVVADGWAMETDRHGGRSALCPLCAGEAGGRVELMPFDARRRCCKCGGNRIAVRYGEGQGDEWLSRTCRRCGYQWREACKDKGQ